MGAPGVVIDYILVNLVVGLLVAVGAGAACIGIWLLRDRSVSRRSRGKALNRSKS